MTVQELYDFLGERIKFGGNRVSEAVVCIPVHGEAVVGSHPSIEVLGGNKGIDWDNGRFFLWLEQEVKRYEK